MNRCPTCDGLGEWDEGPINTHFGYCLPADPEYRQVICPDCDGSGRVEADDYPEFERAASNGDRAYQLRREEQ